MKIKSFFKFLGPGLITGASDDDPSGIATYSQAGAQFGFGTLWLALFQLPLMIAIQEMCARIGLVTGSGLAAFSFFGPQAASVRAQKPMVARCFNEPPTDVSRCDRANSRSSTFDMREIPRLTRISEFLELSSRRWSVSANCASRSIRR